MIRALQRQLALLLVGTIGGILLCASGAALWVSEWQLSLRERAAFDAQLASLTQDCVDGPRAANHRARED